MATMAAFSFTDLMVAYDEAAYLNSDRGQAEMLVESGVAATRVILAQPPAVRAESGGVYSNPSLFQAINVVAGPDASTRGNFTIVAPAMDELGQMAGLRYGLQNESAKLNLNVLPTLETSGEALTAVTDALGAASESGALAADVPLDPAAVDGLAQSLLLAVPGMSVETADCILDYLDADDEPREFGAESEYYLSLPSPYDAKNGPLDSVEELLLVKGVTPWLLFGADANRNGVIDASEQMAASTGGEGLASLGWTAYLTTHSLENNKRADGTPRINVNADDLETLYTDLSDALGNEDWASYIVAYRIAGAAASQGGSGGAGSGGSGEGRPGGGEPRDDPAEGNQSRSSGGSRPAEDWSAQALDELDLSGGAGVKLGQLLDLVGSQVTIGEGDDARTFRSPFSSSPLSMVEYLPALMGNLTTQDYTVLPGRININECPAELIRGIPMIAPEVAEAIIEARAEDSQTENRMYETWPLAEGIVTLEEMKTLMPILTAGGDVYSAQVVGYFEGKNASSRVQVILDATSVNPKIAYWRDLSHLGRGFDVAVLGVRAPDAYQAAQQAAGN
ncbi:type II secretion system protein GspK [Candidatus Laterigemmans baculatus]|uniref:type II secretion system protein GspK n=1 Tax=Candidatus Laterigemmans baculatus TaxID=2770505 RepID=UPI001F26CAA4|nr:type II secretion system protein GspK [Candidatus Laterigemmans baculatus]